MMPKELKRRENFLESKIIAKNSPAQWAKKNLFSSKLNSIITIVAFVAIAMILRKIIGWGILDADFTGSTAEDCHGQGACWVFVKTHLSQFMYGLYPEAERWRIDVTLGLFCVTLLAWKFASRIFRPILLLWSLVLYPAMAWVLLLGGNFGLETVETALWGGLSLTLIIAVVGIVCSLPLGTLLALARRSKLTTVHTFAVLFIELWRGVPLITVLFMSSVMLPLFFPEGFQFNKLLRALIGVSLFSSAYLAETVRGGLAAIPKGQYEAATALGLTYWKTTRLIVLPQALRIVIPGIVNSFIGLFKDTTLVAIIGMFDLLGIVQTAATDPAWLGFATEGYVFAGAVFWVFCFAMSQYSQAVELKLKNDR
jgi:general L-amino acid transport system permease protein